MPWGAVAGAVISAGASYMAAGDASDSAESAAAQEAEWRREQLGLDRERLDFAKEQYGKHEARWDPVLDELLARYDDYEPDFTAIAGDVNDAFASERGQRERYNRRYGIRPDDGSARQFNLQHNLDKATAHVGTRNKARQGAEEIKFARLSDLYGMGQGIQSNSAAQLSSAYAGSAAGYGNAANAANRNMQYYDQAAAGNWAGVGSAIGSVDWGSVFNSVRGNPNSGGGDAGFSDPWHGG